MCRFFRFLGPVLGFLLTLSARGQLVAPPTVDWVSVPSTATVGQVVNVGVGAHANPSDNSDGNNWNSSSQLVVAAIIVDLQRPGQSDWTRIYTWLDPWRTPAEIWTSFTVNNGGTHYIRVQVMDGRPWYSDIYTYAIGVPNPAPAITSQLTMSANQGQSVSYQITATNNPTSYGASNLPSGFSVNTSTGLISGAIPTNGGVQGGNSTVNSTITATNSAGSDNKTLVWNITASVISLAASVSPSSIVNGQSVTLTRAGSANFGIAWTENVIWKPDGSAQVLGNMQLGSMSYTPAAGTGTYWYQFRIVDGYYNYRDQWISFTVNALPPPSGFSATTIGSTFITLSWQAVGGADHYEVSRNGVIINANVLGTSYTDSNLTPATAYTYSIRSVNSSGASSYSTINPTTAGPLEVFTPLP